MTRTLVVLFSLALGTTLTPGESQDQTFRTSVDVIVTEVQVVDRGGNPVSDLVAGDFEVSVNRRRRPVVSAEFVRFAAPSGTRSADNTAIAEREIVRRDARQPLFIIAIDASSLDFGESRGVAEAAQRFIRQLAPNALVGLHVVPTGPRLAPTTDRGTVARRLDTVIGMKESLLSQYHLSPAEVVDITADRTAMQSLTPMAPRARGALGEDDAQTSRLVQIRECGRVDPRCAEDIETEARRLAFELQAQVTEAVNGLQALVQGISAYPGRKTVVVFSGGMPSSDRSGGRPDVGDLGDILGRRAAEANTTIYALHVDSQFIGAADERRARLTNDSGRDGAVEGRTLERLAAASGGSMTHVTLGFGEAALDQIVRETSSYYLLGIDSTSVDQNGRSHELRVNVRRPRLTVRSRTWVTMPRATP